jgi:hypothetical protein
LPEWIGISDRFPAEKGGVRMLQAKPWELAERLTEETGKKVISARDGMTLEIDKAISG